MREELEVGRFATTGAGAGVFEERFEELRGLHIGLGAVAGRIRDREEEVVVFAFRVAERGLRSHVEGLVTRVRLVLRGTNHDAERAAGAVLGGDLDREFVALEAGGFEGRVLERCGGVGQRGGLVVFGADRGVGADEHAFVALDADRGIPDGDRLREVALFPFGGAERPGAVDRKRADWKQVAFSGEHHAGDTADEIRRGLGNRKRAVPRGISLGGDGDFVERGQCGIDGGKVFFHHLGAFAGVGFFDCALDRGDGLFVRKGSGEREEAGLHDGVDPPAHAGLAGDRVGVDGEKFRFPRDDFLLHFARERGPEPLGCDRGVQQHDRSLLGVGHEVILVDELGLVNTDKLGAADEVGRADGLVAEAEVGNGDRTRLFGIVDEIALREDALALADDLDGIFVRSDRAVAAEAVKYGARDARGLDVERVVPRQREMGDIVVDADGEAAFWGFLRQFVEDRLRHAGREFLRGKSVASADQHGIDFEGGLGFGKSGGDITEKRIADRTGVFRAVENRNGANR